MNDITFKNKNRTRSGHALAGLASITSLALGSFNGASAFAMGGPAPKLNKDLALDSSKPALQDRQEGGQIQKNLDHLWLGKYEPDWLRALMFLPRLAANDVVYLVTGKTAQRFANNFVVGADIFSGHEQNALERASETDLNPLAIVQDAVSDGVSLLFSPFSSNGRLSPRLTVCTMNLVSILTGDEPNLLSQINPSMHVSFILDRFYEGHDPGGGGSFVHSAITSGIGASCEAAPIRDNISESLMAEKLYCADHMYGGSGYNGIYGDFTVGPTTTHVSYNFFLNNCGGYTKDTLDMAGVGFPTFPNVGIGVDVFGDQRRGFWDRSKVKCDTHVARIQEAIRELESGTPLTSDLVEYFAQGMGIIQPTHFQGDPGLAVANDTLLQLMISAARGRNAANRAFIASHIDQTSISGLSQGDIYLRNFTDIYYESDLKTIRGEYKDSLVELFEGADKEALAWLQGAFPLAGELAQNLIAQIDAAPKQRVYTPDLKKRNFDLPIDAHGYKLSSVVMDRAVSKKTFTGDCVKADRSDCKIDDTYTEGLAHFHFTYLYSEDLGNGKSAEKTGEIDTYFNHDDLGDALYSRIKNDTNGLSSPVWSFGQRSSKDLQSLTNADFPIVISKITKSEKVIDPQNSQLCPANASTSCKNPSIAYKTVQTPVLLFNVGAKKL
jgi:succinate dehydrogenase flavin-adding protein (antitoxin of CptAB toxin-antitoxin module)